MTRRLVLVDTSSSKVSERKKLPVTNRTVRSRRTPPERAPFKPAPLRVSSNTLISRASNIRTKTAVVRLRQRERPEGDKKRPKIGLSAGLGGSDRAREMPAFCGVPAGSSAGKRMSPMGILADQEEPGSNILFLIFQRLRITHHHLNYRKIADSPRCRRRGGLRGLKSGLRSGPRAGRQHQHRGAPRFRHLSRFECSLRERFLGAVRISERVAIIAFDSPLGPPPAECHAGSGMGHHRR
jgi:hypothetical protein